MRRLGVVSGGIGWFAGAVQFFVVMGVVQLAWRTPYSWADNNISDLGNVRCGDFNGRLVCSPLHELMNVSFVVGGVLIVVGAVLSHQAWPRTVSAGVVRLLLVATGFGWAVAGIFPADVDENAHVVGGALVIFGCGNLALLLTVFVKAGPLARLRWWGFAFGVAGLAAMLLHFSGSGLGLGVGGMERLAAYGVPVWLAAAGVRLLLADSVDHQRAGLVRG